MERASGGRKRYLRRERFIYRRSLYCWRELYLMHIQTWPATIIADIKPDNTWFTSNEKVQVNKTRCIKSQWFFYDVLIACIVDDEWNRKLSEEAIDLHQRDSFETWMSSFFIIEG